MTEQKQPEWYGTVLKLNQDFQELIKKEDYNLALKVAYETDFILSTNGIDLLVDIK